MDKKYEKLPIQICYGNAIIIFVIFLLIFIPIMIETNGAGYRGQDTFQIFMAFCGPIFSLNILTALVSSLWVLAFKKKGPLLMLAIMKGTFLSIGWIILAIGSYCTTYLIL